MAVTLTTRSMTTNTTTKTPALPRAMLIDMDDTILSAYSKPELAWTIIATEFADDLAPYEPQVVAAAITGAAREFWSKAGAEWRIRLIEARQITVKNGFAALAATGGRALPNELAVRIGDRFTAYREEQIFVFPGAHEAIDEFKARGVKLALVTNGAAEMQRAKIERFALTHRFDHIQIEGEHGFGKPEEKAYRHAMATLGVGPEDTWMVGDNLEWEIVAPQRLGIYAIWIDVHGDGLPAGSTVKPDRIIRSLTELVPGTR
jgi:putative hydrolase of the HAD superfamily